MWNSHFSKLGKWGKKSWPQLWEKEVFKIVVALCLYTSTKRRRPSRADLVWALERASYVNSMEEALRLSLLRMYFNLAQSSSNNAPPKVLKAIFRAYCTVFSCCKRGRMCFSFHVTPWN